MKNFGNGYAEAGELVRFNAYTDIHNFGGSFMHPGSDKFQAWMGANGMVFTHGTRPHMINMPARPFILFQEEDFAAIDKIFKSYAVDYFDSHREKIQ